MPQFFTPFSNFAILAGVLEMVARTIAGFILSSCISYDSKKIREKIFESIINPVNTGVVKNFWQSFFVLFLVDVNLF